jgi:hypothetical protein
MPVFGLDLSDFGFLSLPFDMEMLLCACMVVMPATTDPSRLANPRTECALLQRWDRNRSDHPESMVGGHFSGFPQRRREHFFAALVRDGMEKTATWSDDIDLKKCSAC